MIIHFEFIVDHRSVHAHDRNLFSSNLNSEASLDKYMYTAYTCTCIIYEHCTCKSCFFCVVEPEEIKKLSRRFKRLDLNKDGALSMDEFMTIPELQQNPLVKRVIDILDKDGNGQVDFQGIVIINLAHMYETPEMLSKGTVECTHGQNSFSNEKRIPI